MTAIPAPPWSVIIEHWIPHGTQAKCRTIIQRASAAKEYARLRNITIVYNSVERRVAQQFQRLGVTQENPQAYLSLYGVSLLNAATFVQQAVTHKDLYWK